MTDLTRRSALTLAAAAGVLAAAPLPAMAGSGKLAYNEDENGVMLHGHDSVAYFTEGKAVKGKETITAMHDGVTYQFSSAEHRDMFKADPDKYVPAYGGHCAMGAAMGIKLDVKPELFRVVDGKLYLNVHEKAQKRWLSDIPGHIETADAKWPEIRDIPAAELEPN